MAQPAAEAQTHLFAHPPPPPTEYSQHGVTNYIKNDNPPKSIIYKTTLYLNGGNNTNKNIQLKNGYRSAATKPAQRP